MLDRTIRPVIIGITGASGAALAGKTVDELLALDVPVLATASAAGRMVWKEEMEESFGTALERWGDTGQFTYYGIGDLSAPIASGTFPTLGMAITPCSMSTIAATAHGLSDNLLRRGADVCINCLLNKSPRPRDVLLALLPYSA